MTLSDQDREWVRMVTAEIIHEVTPELLRVHVQACPYGRLINYGKGMLVGAIVGSGLIGGGLGAIITKHIVSG